MSILLQKIEKHLESKKYHHYDFGLWGMINYADATAANVLEDYDFMLDVGTMKDSDACLVRFMDPVVASNNPYIVINTLSEFEILEQNFRDMVETIHDLILNRSPLTNPKASAIMTM